jgi:hypothetical protein
MQLNIPGACRAEDLLTAECSWTYGSVENMLWEGVGASAQLRKGPATISLVRHRSAPNGRRRAPRSTAQFSLRRRADLRSDHRRLLLRQRHRLDGCPGWWNG